MRYDISMLFVFLLIPACSVISTETEEEQMINGNASCFTRTIPRETISDSGDVFIKETRINVEGERVSHSFLVDAPTEGKYYLSVFMAPEDHSTYTVYVNGESISGTLRPQKPGWQAIPFTGPNGELTGILLKEGINDIQFFSSSNDFPEIDVLRMTMTEGNAAISTEQYDDYFTRIKSGNHFVTNLQTRSETDVAIIGATDYQYELDCPLLYSFTKTMVLTSGNTGVTFRLANFDEPVILDVFKDCVYTISYLIPAGTSPEIYQNFPMGTYTVHLRRQGQYQPSEGLLCICKNNQTFFYSSCIASGYNFETQPDSYSDGQLNYFTCFQTYGTDPVLYLEKPVPSFYVDAVNDNYIGTGDFDWSVNGRIKQGSTATQHAHIYNASASSPEGSCDFYVRVPSCSIIEPVYGSSSLVDSFPTIKEDDTMLTDEVNSVYNCIGWAGDLFAYVWPTQESSPYYYPGVSELAAFDMYFMARGYTRVGANAVNAGVALWALSTGEITHASVRKNNRSLYPHGYDWESKVGWYSPRVFHEKNALIGDSYGYIHYYYRPDTTITVSAYQTESPFFSEEARTLLNRHLDNEGNTAFIIAFSSLYHDWEKYCKSPRLQVVSNPVALKNDKSYRTLVSFCSKHPQLSALLAIDKLAQGDILAGFLLDDILPKEMKHLKEKAYLHVDDNSKRIIPSMLGNYYRLSEAFLKQLSVE